MYFQVLRRFRCTPWSCVGATLFILTLAGYGFAPTRAAQDDVTGPTSSPQASLPTRPGMGERESWEVYYIRGSKVGSGHTKVRPVTEEGRTLVEMIRHDRLTLTRFGQSIAQEMTLMSVESPSGDLIRFRSELTQGAIPLVTTGRVDGNQIRITTQTQGKIQSAELPWHSDCRGFFAMEQSLEREPLRPGETRSLKAFMPIFNQTAEVTLEALEFERTELLTGTHELLKLRSTTDLGAINIEMYIWADRTGQTLKTYVPTMDQTGYRTTREVALGEVDGTDFDLGDFSIVPIDRPLSKPHETQRIVYRVRLDDGDPSGVFSSGLSQSVVSLDDHSARVEVRLIRPDVPESLQKQSIHPPTADDLKANNLIQSDDARIVRLAHAVVPDESDAWSIARSFERFVGSHIQVKDFSQAFATAAEVAENLEGDCTEHAVLLAALCRARHIPARVAMGLVYYPQQHGFAYHMWNEVWIRDRWVPLDATLAKGGIGAAHLKLRDSNLKGATAYAAFLPVFQVLGRLHIEIESID